jgi:hypothetical protein
MRRALIPSELQALTRASGTVGVLCVAADAGVGEHTVRRALRGARLNSPTACALVVYLQAWEGAQAHRLAA